MHGASASRRARDDLVRAAEAGVELPLVGRADLREGRA